MNDNEFVINSVTINPNIKSLKIIDRTMQIKFVAKVDKLLEIMEKRDTLIKPKEKLEFSDGYFIYKFWGTCKNSLKCEKKPYSKLFEKWLSNLIVGLLVLPI